MVESNEVWVYNNKVVLGTRYWDGYDKPQYTGVLRYSPKDARRIALQMLEKAEELDQFYAKQALKKAIDEHTANIAKAAKEEADV